MAELRFVSDTGLGGENEAYADPVRAAVGAAVERVEVLPDRLLLYTGDGDKAIEQVRAGGLSPATTLVRRSSLEDVFLRLTGRTLVD